MNLKWLPSVCTVLNIGAGVASLLSTFQQHYRIALLWIVIAVGFDLLDGLIARCLNCTSDFGKELDSLADLISFGVAPVFLILLYQLHESHWFGILVSCLFIICGALRLARYNLTVPGKEFVGLPITAAGSLVALISLADEGVEPKLIVMIIGSLSLLMVSRIPFPSLRKLTQRK
jgi:CDP-diacylglycerol---serine O-phosphatidyltransferase